MIWFRGTLIAALAVMVGGLVTQTENTWRGNLADLPKPTMVTWLVDGNNLSCSRNVPNERETILRELSKIATSRVDDSPTKKPEVISNIVIVFDGNEDEESDMTVVEKEKWMEWTVTDGRNRLKDRADDWIVKNTIPRLRSMIDQRLSENKGSTKVNLVSADKELQKRVGATCILNGGSFVHPPKFWNEYLPVLQRQQKQTQPKEQLEEEM